MAIHQEIMFGVEPERLFNVLTNADEFAKATGAPASIEAQANGEFVGFGGKVTGQFVELIPDERIVQRWRAEMWAPDVYSTVTMALSKNSAGTKLTLDHSGYPDEMEPHLDAGWGKMYWGPLKAYLQ